MTHLRFLNLFIAVGRSVLKTERKSYTGESMYDFKACDRMPAVR